MVDNDQDPDDAVRHPNAPHQIAHQNEPGDRLNQNANQNEYRKTKSNQAAAEEVLTSAADLLECHEVVDRLGQLSKTGDGIIGRNCLIRRIALIGREENGFHPYLLGTGDIMV